MGLEAEKNLNIFKFTLFAAIVAVVSSIASIVLINIIAYIARVAYGEVGVLKYLDKAIHSPFEHMELYLIFMIAGLLVGLVAYISPTRRNGGFASMIEAVVLNDSKITPRQGLVDIVIPVISLGVGASVGRFGFFSQIGATIGSLLATVLKLTRDERTTLLCCGATAVLSTMFHSPLGSILFVHEVILKQMRQTFLVPIATASIIGFLFGNFFSDYYQDPFSEMMFSMVFPKVDHGMYPIFILIGVSIGLLSYLFVTSMEISSRFNRYLVSKTHFLFVPILSGFILALIANIFPQTLGASLGVSYDHLMDTYSYAMLIYIFIAKFTAVIVALNFGFNGGTFGPALFLGAIFTSIVVAPFDLPQDDTSLFLVIGMAAMASSIFSAPISVSVMMIEFIDKIDLAAPILIAVLVSHILTLKLYGDYTSIILLKASKTKAKTSDDHLRQGIKRMVKPLDVTVKENASIDEVMKALYKTSLSRVFVVDELGRLKSFIDQSLISNVMRLSKEELDRLSAKDVGQDILLDIKNDDSIVQAYTTIKNNTISYASAPVQDEHGVLIGHIKLIDVFKKYKSIEHIE